MLEYTPGECIDRLVITHLKIWHLEEQMNDPSISLEEKGVISEKIVKLNVLRIRCIDAINEHYGRLKNGT
jgi:hypothetical protein